MRFKPWLTRATLAVTLLGAASLSLAQGPVSPAKKELIQKLLQLQQPELDGMARALAGQAVAPMGQQVGAFMQNRVPPEKREALTKDVQADFTKFGDDVVPLLRDRLLKMAPDIVGPVLEEKLSEDDLRQVITALESPGFRKYMQLTPELQRALGQKLVTDTQAVVEPKIRALEQSLSNKLNAAAPAAAPASASKAAPTPKPSASSAKK